MLTRELLAKQIFSKKDDVQDWFLQRSRQAPPPFYSSIDLRDSGFKVAPVDCNLYPAGFNNICSADLENAPEIFRNNVEYQLGKLKLNSVNKVLIIPESNTQNTFYVENLMYLSEILKNGGFDVRIGWYHPELQNSQGCQTITLQSHSGKTLEAHSIQFNSSGEGELLCGEFRPDWILLNNDFSSGYPLHFDTVSQPFLPSHSLGWHTREKGKHFDFYNSLCVDFSKLINVDPRMIQITTETVEPVDFNENQGIEAIAHAVERVLEKTREFYKDHNIQASPYVFVKSNVGTYGMGVMTVRSPEELLQLNRRKKNKMSVGKNRIPIRSVVVQEGVPTETIVDEIAAEPVIYLSGCTLIGGFLRTNPASDRLGNLNSKGMVFRKLCMADLQKLLEVSVSGEADYKAILLEATYGAIARLSSLAAGQELKAAEVP